MELYIMLDTMLYFVRIGLMVLQFSFIIQFIKRWGFSIKKSCCWYLMAVVICGIWYLYSDYIWFTNGIGNNVGIQHELNWSLLETTIIMLVSSSLFFVYKASSCDDWRKQHDEDIRIMYLRCDKLKDAE